MWTVVVRTTKTVVVVAAVAIAGRTGLHLDFAVGSAKKSKVVRIKTTATAKTTAFVRKDLGFNFLYFIVKVVKFVRTDLPLITISFQKASLILFL